MTVTKANVDAFLTCLEARDTCGATALALRLADEGAPVPQVLTKLVAAAQIEVGERWQSNQYSIADEHAATAISDSVVSVLTANAVPSVDRPNLAVLCADGEWHLLAARLIAEVLRSNGFAITFLGASLPASHLSRFLHSNRDIDVVAISCSTPLAFAGVVSCVAVAHDAGVPVIIGGRALGIDRSRADSLGADLWAPDAESAVRLLHDPLPTALRATNVDVASSMILGLQRATLVDAAMNDLSQRLPRI
ncbi:MAG: cobalamin-dependent protein, partial [Ilumatobacteraceae bacterium]